MPLHLRPPPTAQVIKFPNTQDESREAVIAQLENHHTALVSGHGGYVGRHMFIEAGVAVMVRHALDVGALDDLRAAIEEAVEHELTQQMPVGFAG